MLTLGVRWRPYGRYGVWEGGRHWVSVWNICMSILGAAFGCALKGSVVDEIVSVLHLVHVYH